MMKINYEKLNTYELHANNKVYANYNMNFNEGSFIKNKIYTYKYIDDKEKFFVTTEEGNQQEFTYSEFNIFFTLLTI